MERKDVALLFKRAVEQYLEEAKPKYQNGRYHISEKKLQGQFALALFDKNLPFSAEKYFADDKKRVDFRIYSDFAMEVEIEWEARNTDGFANRTFEDLDKLEVLKPGVWGMFLAVNIGNKYARANRGRGSTTRKAESFCKLPTVLAEKMRDAKSTDLLKCNPRYWRWRYDKRCDVTVLTCFGKRTRNGWAAR